MKRIALSLLLILCFSLIKCKNKEINPHFSVDVEFSNQLLLKKLADTNIEKSEFITTYNEAMIDYSYDSSLNFFVLFTDYFMKLYPEDDLNSLFNFTDEHKRSLYGMSQETISSLLINVQVKYTNEIMAVLSQRLEFLNYRNEAKIIDPSTINFKIEGDIDTTSIIHTLEMEGELSFWHTYKNTQLGNQIFESVNEILSNTMYPGYRDSVNNNLIDTNTYYDTTPIKGDINWDNYNIRKKTTSQLILEKTNPLSAYLFPYANADNEWIEGAVLGYSKVSDTSIVNKYLNEGFVKAILPSRDLTFMWESKSMANTNDGEPLLMLYTIKKHEFEKSKLSKKDIDFAIQEFDKTNNTPMVSLVFNTKGIETWANMTEYSAKNNSGIAICLNNKVFSAPIASERIEGGSTQITGGSFAGEDGIKEAKLLSHIINAGSAPVPVTIKSIKRIKKH